MAINPPVPELVHTGVTKLDMNKAVCERDGVCYPFSVITNTYGGLTQQHITTILCPFFSYLCRLIHSCILILQPFIYLPCLSFTFIFTLFLNSLIFFLYFSSYPIYFPLLCPSFQNLLFLFLFHPLPSFLFSFSIPLPPPQFSPFLLCLFPSYLFSLYLPSIRYLLVRLFVTHPSHFTLTSLTFSLHLSSSFSFLVYLIPGRLVVIQTSRRCCQPNVLYFIFIYP